MKRCVRCLADLVGASWACFRCGFSPDTKNGFVCLAPELAAVDAGFDRASYDLHEAVQAGSFWFRGRNRLIANLARCHFPEARHVLEVGCGSGFALSALRAALPAAQLHGTDVSADALPRAGRRVGPGVELVQMDARRIPWTDEFDLVCAFDVLEHVDDDEAALAELSRALRPGGGVMLSVPQHPALWSRFDETIRHKRRYARRELAEKCRRSGFRILRDTSFVALLLPLMALHRAIRGRATHYDRTREFSLPAWLNGPFERTLDFERAIIRLGISLPAGGSRFVVARHAGSARR